MDFEWEGMLKFVKSCENGQNFSNKVTPVLGGELNQDYQEDLQMLQTRDCRVLPGRPEAYPASYPTTILSSNTEAHQQNSYLSLEINTQQQQILRGDPIQHYPEDLNTVAALSQAPQTSDGSALAIQPAPEHHADSYLKESVSYNLEVKEQDSFPSFGDSTQQQHISYTQPQDYNALRQVYNEPQNDIYRVDYCVPLPEEAVNYNGSSSIQQTVQDVQKQSPTSTEASPANANEIQGIEIAVLGNVYQNAGQGTQQQTPKKDTIIRKSKKWKTFISNWNCTTCNRSFKSQGGLTQHNQNIHSGPAPHGCDICGKRFKDFETMEKHRGRHLAKDKPFKCDWCPNQFFRFSDMQRHANLHHGLSRFRCSICGRAFGRADHVKDHELSHENGTVKKFKNQNRK